MFAVSHVRVVPSHQLLAADTLWPMVRLQLSALRFTDAQSPQSLTAQMHGPT